MPKFSTEETIKRFKNLNNTQRYIEKTSKWIIKLKKHGKEIAALWNCEFYAAQPKQKIAFLHLVNDVLQRGLTYAPEYFKFFEPYLLKTFAETAKVNSKSIRSAVAHLLIVWAQRKIYPSKLLRALRTVCQKSVVETDSKDQSNLEKQRVIAASPFAFSFTSCILNSSKKQENSRSPKETNISSGSVSNDSKNLTSSKSQAMSALKEQLTKELTVESIKPPNIDALMCMIAKLDNPPSADAAVRKQISEFKQEISDHSFALQIIEKDKSSCKSLISRIEEASKLLDNYNNRLEQESLDRSALVLNLRAYRSSLIENAQNAKNKLRKLQSDLQHTTRFSEELKLHLSNLPDVPDNISINYHLEPLPAINDLFK